MTVVEDNCVDCGLPCMGNSCRYKKVSVKYCDVCGAGNATYEVDGKDLCYDCAAAEIKEIFDDMTLSERAEACNVHLVDWR